MIDQYTMLTDLSDGELEAVIGGRGITINISPTIIINTAIVTSITNQTEIAVIAASKLVNSHVSLSQNAKTQAQSIMAFFH